MTNAESNTATNSPAPTFLSSAREQAEALYRKGHYRECLQTCSRILDADRSDREALLLTGNCCLKIGDVRAAIVVFHLGLQLQPDNTDFLMGFGNAAALADDPGTAQSMFLKAHTLNPSDRNIRRAYWDMRARDIHASLGENTNDYAVLRGVIAGIAPTRVLDIGCGSGRLFPLFAEMGIPEIVGQDIAVSAMELARTKHPYPGIQLTSSPILDLRFPDRHFGLIVSNRTLQHVTPDEIEATIRVLCAIGTNVYINEWTDTEGIASSNWHVFKHAYPELFLPYGFVQRDQGSFENGGYLREGERLPGHQRWMVLSKAQPNGESTSGGYPS